MRQTLLAYFGLAVLIFCFAGIGTWFVPEGSSFFLDFQSLIGSFGCLQFPNGTEVCDVTLKHGTGAKAGFIYCLGLIPSIMITCGILNVLQLWNTDKAAQRLFSAPVRFLTGLPGITSAAMFISPQSSDAGAMATKELHNSGAITDNERDVLAMWQFSSSGTLINIYSNGLALLPIIVTPIGNILLIIIAAKFLGANLMRLTLRLSLQAPQSASQAFFSGCKSGLNLALYGILPRVMVAFIFISVLEACGAMSLIGDIFTPLMHVWSLPGEAAVVLATAILSNAAAVGTIVSLFASGTLSAADATILMPGLYLMGALFQFAARVLGTAGVSRKIWPAMFAICLVNSAAAMWITAWLVR